VGTGVGVAAAGLVAGAATLADTAAITPWLKPKIIVADITLRGKLF
jgi:hypothetical protein